MWEEGGFLTVKTVYRKCKGDKSQKMHQISRNCNVFSERLQNNVLNIRKKYHTLGLKFYLSEPACSDVANDNAQFSNNLGTCAHVCPQGQPDDKVNCEEVYRFETRLQQKSLLN